MKIVSLLPSATEIVYALGLDDHLVAVTHECDYPPTAGTKPVITASVLDHSQTSSAHIHHGITELVHKGSSIYHLDENLLGELKPDLILTQELCDVCAVSYEIVHEAAKILPGETAIISLEPSHLRDIFDNLELVAERTGKSAVGNKVVSELQNRLDIIQAELQRVQSTPGVYCMEWLDPPFAAGHWVPEMVRVAGGSELFGKVGQSSFPLEWQVVLDASPEILVLMPCGFDVQRSLGELPRLEKLPGWWDLPAVRNHRVYAVNGSAFFNRPGPRVVTGVEILAQVIHGDIFNFSFGTDAVQSVYPA